MGSLQQLVLVGVRVNCVLRQKLREKVVVVYEDERSEDSFRDF